MTSRKLHFTLVILFTRMANKMLRTWQFYPVLLGAILWAGDSPARKKSSTHGDPVSMELNFVRCHDGDTCLAKTKEGLSLKIRLLGVDAPEVASKRRGSKSSSGQTFGAEAAVALNKQVQGKTLPVDIHGTDAFGRHLALVWTTRKTPSINETLIRDGYAFAYRGRRNKDLKDWAANAEEEARKNKKGFWALQQRPEAPYLFRKSEQRF
jgi:micrococcal nuclease